MSILFELPNVSWMIYRLCSVCITRELLLCYVSVLCRNIIGAINNYRKFQSFAVGQLRGTRDTRYDTRKKRYVTAPFSEKTRRRTIRSSFWRPSYNVYPSSSCRDLEVTESCMLSLSRCLMARCGAINPNKVGREGERERTNAMWEEGRGS